MHTKLYRSRYLIFFLALAAVLAIYYLDYRNDVALLQEQYVTQQAIVEMSILNAVHHSEALYGVLENHFSDEMRRHSQELVEKYAEDSNVFNWDLDAFKEHFGQSEIYIIDQNLKVIRTSYEPDLGLDFTPYANFAELLRQRMQGTEFSSDRLDVSINTGELRKFSYMPTPDHKYLLELSVAISDQIHLDHLDIVTVAKELAVEYPSVANILVYKFGSDGAVKEMNDLAAEASGEPIPEDTLSLIQAAIRENKAQTTVFPGENGDVSKKIIPYLTVTDGKLDWWNSYVIEVVYDSSELTKELAYEKKMFVTYALTVLIAVVLLIAAMEFLFRKLIRAEEKMRYLAHHDHLTGLPNRKLFEQVVHKTIACAFRDNQKFALVFIDLDDFKNVNDEFGHDIGDQLLQEIGSRLTVLIRNNDCICRLGGDEFTLLIQGIKGIGDARAMVARIHDAFQTPFVIDGIPITATPSMGVSIFPNDGGEPEELVKKADDAMYQAKTRGRNQFCFAQSS